MDGNNDLSLICILVLSHDISRYNSCMIYSQTLSRNSGRPIAATCRSSPTAFVLRARPWRGRGSSAKTPSARSLGLRGVTKDVWETDNPQMRQDNGCETLRVQALVIKGYIPLCLARSGAESERCKLI